MTITEHLEIKNIQYKKDADTSKISSIRAGGIADFIIYPQTIDEFIFVLILLDSYQAKYKVIGGCTNVFFCDEGYGGFIVSTKLLSGVEIKSSNEIIAQAGAPLSRIILFGAKQGFKTKSALFGIPGTLGGALRNNAGAFGADISDCFIGGTFFDLDSKKTLFISSQDLNFSYRYSALQDRSLIFLDGAIKGKAANREDILAEIESYKTARLAKQPSEPSLGSFFKRGSCYYASELIDNAGLKGYSVGGAEVSKKHAGFIINKNKATASDINELAGFIEKIIYEKYSFKLEREAEYIN